MLVNEILSRLKNVGRNEKGWTAKCPSHDDKTPSLSIAEGAGGRILLHCHAGCHVDKILAVMGLNKRDLMAQAPETQHKQCRIVKTYDYTDATGKLIFQVVRFHPKSFRQRQPDGNGGWAWNMTGVERVLYRLPQLIEAMKEKEIIFVVEGERDVHAAESIGLTATCNSGGAGKWEAQYAEALRGADCVIIPDRDQPGKNHAELAAKSIYGVARRVRIVELPGKGKDLSDFLEEHDAQSPEDLRAEIESLAKAAPDWTLAADDAKATKPDQDDDKIIVLPGASVSITKSAENIFRRIAPSHELFIRGGVVMELRADDNGGLRLDILRAQAFRSRIEKLGMLFAWRSGQDGRPVLKPIMCPTDTAEALLASQPAADLLPKVRGLAACAVLAEVDGQAQVLAKGYHAVNGGLLITAGKNPTELVIDEAVKILQLLVADFDFATPSDRARALASFITPGLRIGGWIRGHIPIDIAEANLSQSGKGYRQKLIFAVYGEEPYRIALRDGGVGGLDESIQQALITGRPFIQIDNVRGHIESQFIEMMATAGGCIGARVPHKGEVLIDSRHFVLMLTSNGVETTHDLANRASIIRIRKRPGYVFRKFSEGDLLDHVRTNQPHFLGAIFAVIRTWQAAGKLRTTDTRHDFREWAQVLGWIVENILGEAPLMDGHEQAQERVSNPALTWLRRVALAVEADQRLDEEIMAGGIGELCEAHGIEIPGLRDASDETTRNKRVGILMKKAFNEADQIDIDRCRVRRTEKEHYYQDAQQYKTLRAYVFNIPQPELPELPE